MPANQFRQTCFTEGVYLLKFLQIVLIVQSLFSCNIQKPKFRNRSRRCQCDAQWNPIGFLERCGTCKYNSHIFPWVSQKSNNRKRINCNEENLAHMNNGYKQDCSNHNKNTNSRFWVVYWAKVQIFCKKTFAGVRRFSIWLESCCFGFDCATKFPGCK